MLERLDANGDGVLDENELEGGAGRFVRRLQQQAGMGDSGKVEIDKLTAELAKQRGEDPPESSRRGGREPLTKYGGTEFGVSTELDPVLGFDAPPQSSGRNWQSQYDSRIVAQVNELMEKHDTNKSHYLEPHEWPEVPFRSDPTEDDADGDGRISRAELAAHLEKHSNRGRGGNNQGERGNQNERGGRGGPQREESNNDRERTPARQETSRASTTASSSRPASGGDRYRSHAEAIMEEYDLDGDGFLDEEEWSALRGEPDPAEFDRNGDGRLSIDELAARVAAMSRGAESSSPASGSSRSRSATQRFLTPTERLPRGLPEWFTRSDANGDGQVSMAEFADTWTAAKIQEFERYDLNGDGVITAEEALQAGSRR